jgi:AcrR family transcriptional regulator
MPGLRELKKARTRALIQRNAMRLFRQQGYGATTIEQIAELSEIAPSTFFRYFRSKDDVLLADEYDPVLIAALMAQPSDMSALDMVWHAWRDVLGGLPPKDIEALRERFVLISSQPQLRAPAAETLARTTTMLAELAAERVGATADGFAVAVFAGALQGAWTAALFRWAENDVELVDLLDEVIRMMREGFPI